MNTQLYGCISNLVWILGSVEFTGENNNNNNNPEVYFGIGDDFFFFICLQVPWDISAYVNFVTFVSTQQEQGIEVLVIENTEPYSH